MELPFIQSFDCPMCMKKHPTMFMLTHILQCTLIQAKRPVQHGCVLVTIVMASKLIQETKKMGALYHLCQNHLNEQLLTASVLLLQRFLPTITTIIIVVFATPKNLLLQSTYLLSLLASTLNYSNNHLSKTKHPI